MDFYFLELNEVFLSRMVTTIKMTSKEFLKNRQLKSFKKTIKNSWQSHLVDADKKGSNQFCVHIKKNINSSEAQ